MNEKGASPKRSPEDIWLWKSQARLRFLTAMPSFQKDVRAIRKELGIPADGEKSPVLSIEDFKNVKPNTTLIGKTPEERKEIINAARDKRAKERIALAERVGHLADKYNLSENFRYALERHVRLNVIGGPSTNWELDIQINHKDAELMRARGVIYDLPGPLPIQARWIDLKIYAPLREDELRAAIKEIKSTQRQWFAKGAVSLKARQEFLRNVEIFEMWQEMAQDDVGREDRMTSKDIGEQFDLSGGAVRQIIKDMKKLAKEMFGVERF